LTVVVSITILNSTTAATIVVACFDLAHLVKIIFGGGVLIQMLFSNFYPALELAVIKVIKTWIMKQNSIFWTTMLLTVDRLTVSAQVVVFVTTSYPVLVLTLQLIRLVLLTVESVTKLLLMPHFWLRFLTGLQAEQN
jgi:hypothetical protein